MTTFWAYPESTPTNGEEFYDESTCECLTINVPDPSTCVDDGDCSNGFEEWNETTCECVTTAAVLGCTNPTANNFNPDATCDDGTCEFDCPDPGNCDDGDCSNGEEVWDGDTCECIAINVPDPNTVWMMGIVQMEKSFMMNRSVNV